MIPRIIWIYWHQGWDAAPEIAVTCKSTWIANNQRWDVRAISYDSLKDYLDIEKEFPGILDKDLSLASLSDVIRIALLRKFGGVWVDSTLYCRDPLDEWIGFLEDQDFFAFSKPAPDRMVSSWFLLAKLDSLIIQKWYKKTQEYWLKRSKADAYFWFHKLFNKLHRTDEDFRNRWVKVPKVSARPPHFFDPYSKVFFADFNDETKQKIAKTQTPVFKLSHKYDQTLNSDHTILGHILSGYVGSSNVRCLVAWYGSFENNGTVGDLLSVQVLTDYLQANHFSFDTACYKPFDGIKGRQLSLTQTEPTEYDILIFCCGPIMANHPHLRELFERFQSHYKLGIGVSLFPKEHFNYFNPFHHVFAREFGGVDYHDIAALADQQDQSVRGGPRILGARVGVVLRNEQGEYGKDMCKSELANTYLMKLADELSQPKGILGKTVARLIGGRGSVLTIENHIENSDMAPKDILKLYRGCDIVLTTRFHGAAIALSNKIPVIAIDQIVGGAKVFGLLDRLAYPYVWKVNEVDYTVLRNSAFALIAGREVGKISEVQQEMRSGARRSLAHFHGRLVAY